MSSFPVSVLHLTHNMNVGGAEVMIRHLVEGTDSEKYSCSVACIDGEVGSIGQAMSDGGVTIYALDRGKGVDLALVLAIRSILKKHKIEILHCHQYTPYFYGALASLGTRTKVVFTEHGRFFPDRFTWKRRIVNQLLSRITDRIVVISEATRDALVQYEWFPRSRIELIYNGVKPFDSDICGSRVRVILGIDEEALVLGTLSRLDSIKNQSMMLKALHAVTERLPNSVLLLAGDGPERESLEKEAAELGLRDRVFFAGFVSDTANYLEAMDVFMLTSFSEGTSMTLLEAMSLGKPIIASRVGGNVEVIENLITGLLIDSNDVIGLRDAIEQLESDASLGRALGNAAKTAFYDRFELQHMISSYEQLYASMKN